MTDFKRIGEKEVTSKIKPYGLAGGYCTIPYEWFHKGYKKVKVIVIE